MPERPAPGWYRDPKNPSIERYWYGDVWSPDKTRPAGLRQPERPLVAKREPKPATPAFILAVLALLALGVGLALFIAHPTATYFTTSGATDTTPCISAWQDFSDTGSRITPRQAAAKFGSTQDALSASAACKRAIAGRDHISLALLIVGVLLAGAALAVRLATPRSAPQ